MNSYHVCIIFMLANGEIVSCDGCINATMCRANTGNYLLQFSKLFDQSNNPPCELFYLDRRPVINVTLTEGKCIPIPPNFSYYIQCPICHQVGIEIYHTIFFSDIKNCSNGICGETLTTANVSTVISSAETSLSSVYLASSTAASTIMPTLSGGSNSNNADENFTGVAVGVSVGMIVLVAVIITIIIISWLCYKKNKETNANKVTSKSLSGMIATSQDNILNTSFPDINMPDCAIPHEHAFSAPNGALTSIDNATNTGHRGDEHNKATRAERFLQLLNCDYKQLSKTITKLHPIINKHINFDTLIPFLSFYHIFTDDEMEILMNVYKTKAEKVNELITSLPTKDKDGIYNFVKALNDAHEHSGHGEILDNLKEQLFS